MNIKYTRNETVAVSAMTAVITIAFKTVAIKSKFEKNEKLVFKQGKTYVYYFSLYSLANFLHFPLLLDLCSVVFGRYF